MRFSIVFWLTLILHEMQDHSQRQSGQSISRKIYDNSFNMLMIIMCLKTPNEIW